MDSNNGNVPICPFDGRVCDGKVLFGAPSCFQESFGVDSRGHRLPKRVGVCRRFKLNVRPKV